MKKILAFGASNSSQSINQQLAVFTANQLENVAVTVLDLNDFEMPLYGIDKEKANGIPSLATDFANMIAEHDAIVLSLAEHNGGYSVAFKNITDWVSRIKEAKVWRDKPILLLSTSPGGRGGANVMATALKLMPYAGAEIIANFSLPFFYKNFSAEKGIINDEFKTAFEEKLAVFIDKVLLVNAE